MEVHAHAHTPRKKWTHYLWEFLMLFFAVTLGFFVENQREHMVEYKREKEYMKSMLEDLKQDTVEFSRGTRSIDQYFSRVLAKSTKLLYGENFSDSSIREMYDTVAKSIRFFTITFQENTVTQLKNSGNLRLIRNKELTDSLAKYWNGCDYLKNTLIASYELTRLNSKELIYSIFNYSYFENNSPTEHLRKNASLKLMSNDRLQFIKLGNYLSNLHTQLSGSIFQRLKDLDLKASQLITLIQKEYHLK
jgi:hypothetical protein